MIDRVMRSARVKRIHCGVCGARSLEHPPDPRRSHLAQHDQRNDDQQNGQDHVVVKALIGREKRRPDSPPPTMPTMVEFRRLESN